MAFGRKQEQYFTHTHKNQVSYLSARSAPAIFMSWMNEAGILRSTSIAGNWRWLRWWRQLSMDELSCFSLIASIRGTWLLICAVESSTLISKVSDCSSMAADSDDGESFAVFNWLWFSLNRPSGFSASLSVKREKKKCQDECIDSFLRNGYSFKFSVVYKTKREICFWN